MHCAACSRPHSSRLPFHCVACARNALYELRLQNAGTLLHREALGREVEGAAASDLPGLEREASQALESRERVAELRSHSTVLRAEIETGKADISRLKTSLAARRSDLASRTHNLPSRRATTLASVERGIARMKQTAVQQHQMTAESRVFLCQEAANLYGLRQRRRRKGGVVKEDYIIGGVGIVDLRDLNNAPPTQITTSLTHLSHLLVLTSHYLSLQLPAEITLPHRDYPLPTILSPASSYTSRVVPFPGTTPSHSSSNSPTASRTGDLPPLPRPRPLYLSVALPALAKDDPAGYALLIEGVALLAWNIAWVCRTQGLSTPSHSWEDVCPLGRNLYQLLHSPSAAPPATAPANQLLGHFSHGTAHAFLGAARGVEHMRAWRLRGAASAMQVADKLKGALLGELAGAEWEMLDQADAEAPPAEADAATKEGEGKDKDKDKDKAVADAGPGAEEGADVGGGGPGPADEAGAGRATPSGPNPSPSPGTGTSGWTKLKPR
ncbi:MAG: hypothetical protein M1832_004115 [Thelocarpon impressellum]|nr:MAG: hypothetical protein M1832_004115 [Thelocarpon impressellum]